MAILNVNSLKKLLVDKNQELLLSCREIVSLEKRAAGSDELEVLLTASEKSNWELATQAAEESNKLIDELGDTQKALEDSQKLSEDLRVQLAESEEKARGALATANLMLQDSEKECEKLRTKYQFWKAKASRALKQLSFFPWLWDHLWVHGFNWGFENMRELVTYLDRYMVDLKEVEETYHLLPLSATDEMYSIGKDLILDV